MNHLDAFRLKIQLKRHKMDDLLLKVAELADPKLTIGSSDNDNDKILFEAACQFDSVPPSSAKKAKDEH